MDDIIDPGKGNRFSYFFQIRQSKFKDWLSNKGFSSTYFGLVSETETYLIDRSSGYSTKLMKIMSEVVSRYYGDNFDPDDSDTTPKQVDVIEWLTETYSLSDRQAMAIDIVTRPESVKSLRVTSKERL